MNWNYLHLILFTSSSVPQVSCARKMASLLASRTAKKVAEINANCFKVMRSECGECGKVCEPKSHFTWSLVNIVNEDNSLAEGPGETYVVPSENLRDLKYRLFSLSLGKSRVSNN